MRKYFFLFFTYLMLSLIASVFPLSSSNTTFASYEIYTPESFPENRFENVNEKILFILDFSNSMTEYLNGESKVNMMKRTMSQILPKIDKNIPVGLRVYGHKAGFTPLDACKASSTIVPIAPANNLNIESRLLSTNPKGMTPITYSLKEAIRKDFVGYTGTKHIILLTDGGENCDESPCKFVMELIKIRQDVKIDVIAFNIQNRDDLEQLACTSLVTSGKFYTANTATELVNSLNESIKSKKEVEAKIYTGE